MKPKAKKARSRKNKQAQITKALILGDRAKYLGLVLKKGDLITINASRFLHGVDTQYHGARARVEEVFKNSNPHRGSICLARVLTRDHPVLFLLPEHVGEILDE